MESLIAPKKPSTSCGLGTSGSGTTKNIRIPNPSHQSALVMNTTLNTQGSDPIPTIIPRWTIMMMTPPMYP